MMETLTFVVKQMSIEVVDGRVKKSRLWYTAPNLEIYVFGAVSVPRRDQVHHHAMQEALNRHIPLRKLIKHGAL